MDQPCRHLSVSQVCLPAHKLTVTPSFSHCSVSNWSADCCSSLSCCSISVRLSPVCLSVCVSNGRAVHYNGSSLLQWKSVRLDVALLPGETGDNMFIIHSLFFDLVVL